MFESTADKNHPELPVLAATQEFGMIKRDDTGINISHDKRNEATYKRVLPGQFVIHLRSFQGGFAHSAFEGITSPAYTVFGFRDSEKQDDYFWKYIFHSDAFIHRLETVTYGIRDGRSISYEEFLTMNFYVPSYEEQKRISTFLLKLNHLITLHQRVSFRERVTRTINGHKKTDSWEQRKLREYLETSQERNSGGLYGREDVLSVSGDLGVVNQIEFQGRSFAGASVANYGVVHTHDVVYTKSPLKASPYGIIKANKGKPGIVSTLYAVYRPLQEVTDSDFVQCYFEQGERLNSYLHPLVNKGAKNDMKVSDDNALNGDVIFPSLPEQREISAFLSKIDDLITLHQREYLLFEVLLC